MAPALVADAPRRQSDPTPELPLAWDGSVLRPEAQLRWFNFWRSVVSEAVEEVDMERLESWIRAVNERMIVWAELAREPLVAGAAGQPRMNPLLAVVRELSREIEAAEDAFGMNPKARIRLGIQAGTAKLTAQMLQEELDRGREPRGEPIPAEFRGADAPARVVARVQRPRAKLCSKCRRLKDFHAFGSNGGRQLRSRCKQCRNWAERARRVANSRPRRCQGGEA